MAERKYLRRKIFRLSWPHATAEYSRHRPLAILHLVHAPLVILGTGASAAQRREHRRQNLNQGRIVSGAAHAARDSGGERCAAPPAATTAAWARKPRHDDVLEDVSLGGVLCTLSAWVMGIPSVWLGLEPGRKFVPSLR